MGFVSTDWADEFSDDEQLSEFMEICDFLIDCRIAKGLCPTCGQNETTDEAMCIECEIELDGYELAENEKDWSDQ